MNTANKITQAVLPSMTTYCTMFKVLKNVKLLVKLLTSRNVAGKNGCCCCPVYSLAAHVHIYDNVHSSHLWVVEEHFSSLTVWICLV